MNLYLLLLCLLAGFNLIIYSFILILDLLNTSTKQKLTLIKMGYTIIFILPFIFKYLHTYPLVTFNYILSHDMTNQLVTETVLKTVNKLPLQWSSIIFIFYEIGFLIMLNRMVFSYFSAYKKLRNSITMSVKGQSVFLNNKIHTPLSFGFPKAKIYLPQDAEQKWTAREIEMILVHENNHIENYDCLWKLLSLLVKSILFFAPWAYVLHKKLELEMEIYADEQTCLKTNSNLKEYGELLLKIVSNLQPNMVFINLTDSTLTRRFLAMKNVNKKDRFLTIILSALLIAGGTAIASTNIKTDKTVVFDITSKIILDGKVVSNPQIITYPNQEAMICLSNKDEKEGVKMKLIAKDHTNSVNKKAIDINYDIEYKSRNINFQTKQEIITLLNQETKIHISSSHGHTVELAILAKIK